MKFTLAVSFFPVRKRLLTLLKEQLRPISVSKVVAVVLVVVGVNIEVLVIVVVIVFWSLLDSVKILNNFELNDKVLSFSVNSLLSINKFCSSDDINEICCWHVSKNN